MKKIIPLLALFFVFACKSPTPRKPVTQKTSHFMEESKKRNKELQEQQEKRIHKIISRDTLHEYHTSPNGFWYRYDKKVDVDSLKTPSIGDLVFFEYNIATLNGTPIYSRDELGKRKLVIDKENVFTGLRQGLKLMKIGETLTFYFPSYKAFGYYGDNKRIGHNVPIRCTITLNDIKFNHNNKKQFIKHQ